MKVKLIEQENIDGKIWYKVAIDGEPNKWFNNQNEANAYYHQAIDFIKTNGGTTKETIITTYNL